MMYYVVMVQKLECGNWEGAAVFDNDGDAIVYKNINKQFYHDIFIDVKIM